MHIFGFSSLILIRIFLKCKINACNDDARALYLFDKHGMLQLYPPYKNLVPRFLRTREKGRVLGSKAILSFPGCFLLRVMRPLDFQEFDASASSYTLGFVKDTNRILSIS
jgi:hypothetical protein